MSLTIPRTYLLPLIAGANAMAVPGPIEATLYAFMSVEGGKLYIRATDGINDIRLYASCDGSLEPVQIDAAKLHAVASKMRGKTFKITASEGKLKLTSKEGGSRTIPTVLMPYPQPPAVTGTSIALPTETLRTAVAFVRDSASTDVHQRPHLCGVHIHQVGGLYKIAAAYASGVSAITLATGTEDIAVTIGSDTVKYLGLIPTQEVVLIVGERAVQFEWDGGSLRGSRVALDFVNYQRSVPTYETYLSIRASELLECMNAIAPVAAEDFSSGSQIMRLRLSDTDVILQGAGDNEQPVDAEWHGPPLVLGFISKRMKAALDGFGNDELRIEIGGGEMPIAVRSVARDDRVSVLMPVRC